MNLIEKKATIVAALQISLTRLLLKKKIITGEELKKEIMDVTKLSEEDLDEILRTMIH